MDLRGLLLLILFNLLFPTKVTANIAACPFLVDNFLQAIGDLCSPYLNSVQACPNSTVKTTTRVQAASQLARCQTQVLNATILVNANLLPTYGPATEISKNSSCSFPKYLPYLKSACAFDFNLANGTCPPQGPHSDIQHRISQCVNEVSNQYVRCTRQKPSAEIDACINDNAQKVDWIKQIGSYEGADSCPVANHVIVQVAMAILVGTIFALLTSGRFWKIVKKRRSQDRNTVNCTSSGYSNRIQLQAPKQSGLFAPTPSPMEWPSGRYEMQPWQQQGDFRFFRLSKEYIITAHGILFAIGIEVLTAYLTTLIIRKQSEVMLPLLQEFSFYIIKPRPAPFIGIFGLFEPWNKVGLENLVVDGIISYLAGTLIGVNYMMALIQPENPQNPAAPKHQLYILMVGAIMTFAPALLVHVIIYLISAWEADKEARRRGERNDKYSGLGAMIGKLFVIVVFFALLPFIAIWELTVMIRNMKRFRGDRERMRMPLTIARDAHFYSITAQNYYYFFLLSSWCINIGNWLFWVSYLKLSGELFCPTKLATAAAVWYVVPISLNIVLGAWHVLIGDPGV